jgi:S-DNA-T family DNA segregation ATPase FtsK/SpoIIIE
MMTRFGIIPSDNRSASRIMKLEPFYKKIFARRELRVYRSEGRILIDVPWRHDEVWLGDLLTSREYESSQGLPLAIGMNLYRECVTAELTYHPNLLVGGTPGSGITEFLQGLLLSILIRQTPEEVDLYLCSSSNLSFEECAGLPYCHVISSVRQIMAMLSDMSSEIDRRSELLYRSGCRDIYQYNERGGLMRHRIIMITEYASLGSLSKETAMGYLLRLTELSGPCGIHIILSSASPASLRGIKDSFPARVCLRVAGAGDSYVLIDQKGAENLKNRGALYYVSRHGSTPQLLQSGSLTNREVRDVLYALQGNYINARRRSIFDEIDEDD